MPLEAIPPDVAEDAVQCLCQSAGRRLVGIAVKVDRQHAVGRHQLPQLDEEGAAEQVLWQRAACSARRATGLSMKQGDNCGRKDVCRRLVQAAGGNSVSGQL